jgi:ribonuclease VapC
MIVDTSAVLAILWVESGADQLKRAIAEDLDPKMSAATLTELYIVADHRDKPTESGRLDALMRALNLRIVPFDRPQAELARRAYQLFGRGSGHPAHLNMGDCFSYALAAQTGEPLLFVGDDFTHTDLTPALRP